MLNWWCITWPVDFKTSSLSRTISLVNHLVNTHIVTQCSVGLRPPNRQLRYECVSSPPPALHINVIMFLTPLLVVFYHNISESVHKLILLRSVRFACRRQCSYDKPYSPHDRWPAILSVPVVSAPVLAIMYECCVVTCTCALYDVTFSSVRAGDVKHTFECYTLEFI